MPDEFPSDLDLGTSLDHDGSKLTRPQLLRRAGAAALLVATGPAALADAALAAPKIVRGGRLRIAFPGGGTSETLDGLLTTTQIGGARFLNLYDPLVRLTSLSSRFKVEYRLATSITPQNPQRTIWNMNLRRNVTFHNGKTFTADDVLYTWRRIIDPANKAGSRSALEPLLDMNRTRKVNDYQITIYLKQPRADLAFALADGFTTSCIVPDGATTAELNVNPIGTGPFRFASWTQGERSLFVRNPNYWNGAPYLDELEMISISDGGARLNALLGGQVEALDLIDFAAAQANARNSRIRILRSPSDQSVPIYMRIDVAPFRDNRVRQAFRLSVDRPKLVRLAFQGYGRVGNDLYGPSWDEYNSSLPQRKYDPERAKFLLKQAGRSDISVTLPTSSAIVGMLESATAWAQQAKASGIRVKIKKVPDSQYFDASAGYLRAPIYQTNWGSSFERQAQQALVPGGPYRETHWDVTHPKWVREFRKAQALLNPGKRKSAFQALQRQLWQEGGDIVWGFFDYLSATSSQVRGVVPYPSSPLGNYRFNRVWIDR